MFLKLRSLLKQYFAAGRDLHPEDFDAIKTLVATTFITAPLMWTYATVTYLYSSSSTLVAIGFITAFVHFFSIFLRRFTKTNTIPTLLMLGAGVCFQGSYAFFDGGFYSELLIWFGVIPFLAGICDSKRAAWILLSIITFISALYLVMDFNGFQFPKTISPEGDAISHIAEVFGWIFISFAGTYFYLKVEAIRMQQIHQANKNTNDILRILLHDISNPLQVAGMSVDRLEKLKDGQNTKGKKNLHRVNSSLQNISEIVKKVKEMHAMKSGKLKPRIEATNVLEIIEQIEENFSMLLKEKSLELAYDKKEMKDIEVLVDPVLFKNQVLGNILSNAIKFSFPGNQIRLHLRESSENMVELSIRDYGLGMPKDLVRDIFVEGAQTSRKGTDGEKGTGFGMLLMNSFVLAMDGKVKVSSIEKKEQSQDISGTIFTIIVPRALSSSKAKARVA